MNYLKFLKYIPLILLLAGISACQPQASVDEPIQNKDILFEDDFEDPSSGWSRVASVDGESDYADGMYRILVNNVNLDIWAKPGLTYIDSSIEVDAIKIGGDRNNRFGVVCRVVSPNEFYTLMISSDGYFGIGKVKGDQYTLIGMDALKPADAIHRGSALNHIRADCIGDSLTLTVNGIKLIEVKDAEYTYGDVGLIAGTYDIPGTDIRFDNFIVTKP